MVDVFRKVKFKSGSVRHEIEKWSDKAWPWSAVDTAPCCFVITFLRVTNGERWATAGGMLWQKAGSGGTCVHRVRHPWNAASCLSRPSLRLGQAISTETTIASFITPETRVQNRHEMKLQGMPRRLDIVRRDAPSSSLVRDHGSTREAAPPSAHEFDYEAYIVSVPQDIIETSRKKYAYIRSDGFGSSSSATTLRLTPDPLLSLVS